MKSRSPFKAKIDIFQGSTSTYRHPSTVIQPIVGAQVGAQIAKTASEVTVKAIEAKSEKPKKQFDFKVGPKPEALTVPDFEYNFRTSGGYEERTIPGKQSTMKLSKLTPDQKKWRTDKINELGPGGYAKYKKELTKDTIQRRSYSLDDKGNKTNFSDWTNSPNTMKGSPAKQIDPYAAINPEAVPGSQAQNVLGAQPIVGADMNQARNVDMQAMIDPYKSPGATFKPGEKINAENIYGQAGQRQALMNLGSPMHAHTPTHGKKYKKGDLFDESDLDKLKTGYDIRHVSTIQEDKEGQFMTTLGDRETFRGNSSKTIDYPRPGAARDTIRPKRGKVFTREN